MIHYQNTLENITEAMLEGFFDGWPNPPSTATFLKLLKGSSALWLAQDGAKVVGFITAVSDGVLSAYIPLLEVLPDYKGRGIGSALTHKMLDSLSHLYMIDLLCDDDVAPFYERLDMRRAGGMYIRNYHRQSGDALDAYPTR